MEPQLHYTCQEQLIHKRQNKGVWRQSLINTDIFLLPNPPYLVSTTETPLDPCRRTQWFFSQNSERLTRQLHHYFFLSSAPVVSHNSVLSQITILLRSLLNVMIMPIPSLGVTRNVVQQWQSVANLSPYIRPNMVYMVNFFHHGGNSLDLAYLCNTGSPKRHLSVLNGGGMLEPYLLASFAGAVPHMPHNSQHRQ